MSSDSEFESTQSTMVAPPSLKRRKTDLRPLPEDTKIPTWFAPGGSLDSQTSDTQWADLHFGQSQTAESQPELGDALGGSSQPEDVMVYEGQSQSPEKPCGDFLLHQVIHIIDLCTEHAIQNLDVKRNNEIKSLRERCEVLEGQLSSITARNAAICHEISREREWIQLLQQSLQDHHIPFPPYPVSSAQ